MESGLMNYVSKYSKILITTGAVALGAGITSGCEFIGKLHDRFFGREYFAIPYQVRICHPENVSSGKATGIIAKFNEPVYDRISFSSVHLTDKYGINIHCFVASDNLRDYAQNHSTTIGAFTSYGPFKLRAPTSKRRGANERDTGLISLTGESARLDLNFYVEASAKAFPDYLRGKHWVPSKKSKTIGWALQEEGAPNVLAHPPQYLHVEGKLVASEWAHQSLESLSLAYNPSKPSDITPVVTCTVERGKVKYRVDGFVPNGLDIFKANVHGTGVTRLDQDGLYREVQCLERKGNTVGVVMIAQSNIGAIPEGSLETVVSASGIRSKNLPFATNVYPLVSCFNEAREIIAQPESLPRYFTRKDDRIFYGKDSSGEVIGTSYAPGRSFPGKTSSESNLLWYKPWVWLLKEGNTAYIQLITPYTALDSADPALNLINALRMASETIPDKINGVNVQAVLHDPTNPVQAIILQKFNRLSDEIMGVQGNEETSIGNEGRFTNQKPHLPSYSFRIVNEKLFPYELHQTVMERYSVLKALFSNVQPTQGEDKKCGIEFRLAKTIAEQNNPGYAFQKETPYVTAMKVEIRKFAEAIPKQEPTIKEPREVSTPTIVATQEPKTLEETIVSLPKEKDAQKLETIPTLLPASSEPKYDPVAPPKPEGVEGKTKAGDYHEPDISAAPIPKKDEPIAEILIQKEESPEIPVLKEIPEDKPSPMLDTLVAEQPKPIGLAEIPSDLSLPPHVKKIGNQFYYQPSLEQEENKNLPPHVIKIGNQFHYQPPSKLN